MKCRFVVSLCSLLCLSVNQSVWSLTDVDGSLSVHGDLAERGELRRVEVGQHLLGPSLGDVQRVAAAAAAAGGGGRCGGGCGVRHGGVGEWEEGGRRVRR